MHSLHTHRDVYVCEGICRRVVSADDYRRGETVCTTEGCERNGMSLSAAIQCDHCGKVRTPEEQAAHDRIHHAA